MIDFLMTHQLFLNVLVVVPVLYFMLHGAFRCLWRDWLSGMFSKGLK